MFQFTEDELVIASRILRHRLKHRLIWGINILNPEDAERPTLMEEHCGQMFGYFSFGSNQLKFYLFGRNHWRERITHMFLFYVNDEHQCVPQSEVSRFKQKIPASLKRVSINFVTRVPSFLTR